jgi:hypothetical protein
MSETAFPERRARLPNLSYPELKAKSVLLAAEGKLPELRHTIHALHEAFGAGMATRRPL